MDPKPDKFFSPGSHKNILHVRDRERYNRILTSMGISAKNIVFPEMRTMTSPSSVIRRNDFFLFGLRLWNQPSSERTAVKTQQCCACHASHPQSHRAVLVNCIGTCHQNQECFTTKKRKQSSLQLYFTKKFTSVLRPA